MYGMKAGSGSGLCSLKNIQIPTAPNHLHMYFVCLIYKGNVKEYISFRVCLNYSKTKHLQ